MRCFKAVKCVLDEAYAQIPAENDEAKDALIIQALATLSRDYRDLTKAVRVDYSDPITRFAYVFRYVTSHADLVQQIISRSRDLRLLFAKDDIHLSCIGGGPGSDLLGIVKHLAKNERKVRLYCEMYDRETAWGETWGHLSRFVRLDEIELTPVFISFDVAAPQTWTKFTRYLRADLFTMIYFMSEVYHLRASAAEFFANAMSKANSGSYFLFADNSMANGKPEFSDWFDELAKENGVSIKQYGDHEKFFMSSDEEKRELEPYFSRFQDPKLTAWISWRVAQKD